MANVAEYTGRLFVKTLRHDTYPSIDPAKWVASGDFVGRVVMITGANRGLGRVMASAFARAGVSGLVLAARNASALETVEEEARAVHPGGDLKIQKISVDVVDEIAVSNAARSVKDTFNRLDVLVNNAGILEKMALIGKSDPDTWWKTWEVDVKGTYLVTRAFLELLLESGNGGVGDLEGRKIVVNLASIAANMVVADGGSAYHTSKLAVLRFTEFLMSEYGPKGLMAFSLDPGAVPTDMGLSLPEAYRELFIDTPELAANTLVWLTKDRKDWLVGRLVVVTWDIDELQAKKEEIVKGDKLKVRLAV